MNIEKTITKFSSFFILIIWFMNLVGTTGYIVWASSKLVELGESSGFWYFGILNVVVSFLAFPAIKKFYTNLVSVD